MGNVLRRPWQQISIIYVRKKIALKYKSIKVSLPQTKHIYSQSYVHQKIVPLYKHLYVISGNRLIMVHYGLIMAVILTLKCMWL